MNLNILKCADCGNKLNDFETTKYVNLLDHWGGRVVDPPRCKTCYWKEIHKVQNRVVQEQSENKHI